MSGLVLNGLVLVTVSVGFKSRLSLLQKFGLK